MMPASPSGALVSLYEWAKREDFSGHDPHDLLNAPSFGFIRSDPSSSIAKWLRLFALQLGRRSLIDLRALLQLPHGENPKALALFLGGLLRAKNAAASEWERDAARLAERLVRSMNDSGWGYPFPWQSRTHYLSPHTPNIVTTSFVGNALIEWQRHSPSASLEKAIQLAADYVISLQLRSRNPGAGTTTPETREPIFGYAKNDPQIVFNASILGAEFLLNAGILLGNERYIALAHQAARFVAGHQRGDGGWDYGLERSQHWTDSFHTGFTIRAMRVIAAAVTDSSLSESAERGFEYYRTTFLEPDFAIKYFPHRRYPIDAHALGEAMLTFEAFGEHEIAQRVAEWCITNMRSPKGYFYYQRHRLVKNKIPYIRWSNAWIFRGLAEVVTAGE